MRRLFAPEDEDLNRPGFFERRPGEPPTPDAPVWLLAGTLAVGLVVAGAAGLLSDDRHVFGILVGLTAWVAPIVTTVGHSTVWLRRLRAGTLPAAELRRAEELAARPAIAPATGSRRDALLRVALVGTVGAVALVAGALALDDDRAPLALVAALLVARLVDDQYMRSRRGGEDVPRGE